MRKILTAVIGMAIVSAACSHPSTPTPTRVASNDEAYLLYIGDIAPNEILAYALMVETIGESVNERPVVLCESNDELEDAARELKYALEGSPLPLDPSLQKHRECLLEAMELQLDITSRL